MQLQVDLWLKWWMYEGRNAPTVDEVDTQDPQRLSLQLSSVLQHAHVNEDRVGLRPVTTHLSTRCTHIPY